MRSLTNRNEKISVQCGIEILKRRRSCQTMITDSKVANRLDVSRNAGQIRGRRCDSICSRPVISRQRQCLSWLSVWQCCRSPVTHLPRQTSAGSAPATWCDSARGKFRTWRESRPACAGSAPVSAKVVV